MRWFKQKSKVSNTNKTASKAKPQGLKSYIEGPKQIQALGHLHRFGWLTISQVSFLLYGECPKDPHANAYKKTRKLLANLYRKNDIYIRILPNNARAYLLSENGAKRLQKITGIRAISGENVLATNPIMDRETGRPRSKKSTNPSWIHRWVSNEFVIRNGLENALTELEIYRRKAPFPEKEDKKTGFIKRSRSWLAKSPDALLVREENGIKYLTWIEVENAKRRSGWILETDDEKQRGSLQSLALWLANALKEDVIFNKVRVEKVIFVIVTSEQTTHRLMRFMTPIVDALNAQLSNWYPEDYGEKQTALYKKIEVHEYLLSKGPRLACIKSEVREHRIRTLFDIAEYVDYERMQPGKTGQPRTDGKINV